MVQDVLSDRPYFIWCKSDEAKLDRCRESLSVADYFDDIFCVKYNRINHVIAGIVPVNEGFYFGQTVSNPEFCFWTIRSTNVDTEFFGSDSG